MSHRFEGDFSRLIRHRREDLDLTQPKSPGRSALPVTASLCSSWDIDVPILTAFRFLPMH